MQWWRRHAGVRARSTLAAATIVTGALLVAALLGWWIAKRTLASDARQVVTSRSQDVAAQVEQRGLAGLEAERTPAFGEVIEVLDSDGRVLLASPASASGLTLGPRLPSLGNTVTVQDPALPGSGSDEPYVVVARGVRDGVTLQPVVVVVGRSVAGLARTVGVVGNLGIVGLPVLVLVTAAVTWIFTGRALQPVEEMRRRVQRITSRRLEERVPVPVVHDEIGRLAETMNVMLASLQAAQAAQRRFIADAGHELRSPLATITTTLEVAAAGQPLDGPTARLVADLAPEASRMQRLVNDLLLLARADEGGLRLRATDVDLDDVVEAEARRQAAGGPGGVRTTVRTEPVRVTGDPDRLAQVVRNLADNARRHTSTRLHLQVRRVGPDAVVSVEDDGPGIPAAERVHVFQRFVRLDEARARDSGGSGLGLAIVQEIVTGHGGQVSVSSGALGGALVEVRLPALPPEAAAADLTAGLATAVPDETAVSALPALPALPAEPAQPPSGSSR